MLCFGPCVDHQSKLSAGPHPASISVNKHRYNTPTPHRWLTADWVMPLNATHKLWRFLQQAHLLRGWHRRALHLPHLPHEAADTPYSKSTWGGICCFLRNMLVQWKPLGPLAKTSITGSSIDNHIRFESMPHRSNWTVHRIPLTFGLCNHLPQLDRTCFVPHHIGPYHTLKAHWHVVDCTLTVWLTLGCYL